MELPSTRELELEALVRQRDGQLAELNDEITRLRQFVAVNPTLAPTDSVTLPPPLLKLLLPHIKNASKPAESSPSTVITALTQKVKLLQDENDELYQILRVKETGKLKEEVRSLRKVVQRLEGSLRESHQVIDSLSTEVDKAYISLMAASKQIPTAPSHHRTSRSPRPAYHAPPVQNQSSNSSNANGSSRGLPTGPRAHVNKKPRLSDPRQSPTPLQHPLPPNPRVGSQAPAQPQRSQQHSHHNAHSSSSHSRTNDSRERKPAGPHKPSGRTSRMEVDEESNTSSRNDKGRDRERDQHDAQQPSTERDRERDSRGNNARERDDKDRNKDRGQKERDRGSGGGGRESRESKDKSAGLSAHGGGSSGSGRGPVSRRNGAYQGNPGRVSSSGGGGSGSGSGHGRRGNSDRHSASQGNGQIDRSLAERMGL